MSDELGPDDHGRADGEPEKVYAQPKEGESKEEFANRFLTLILSTTNQDK